MSDPQPPPEAARADATRRPKLGLRSLAMAIICCGALIWMGRVIWEHRDLDHSIVRESARALRSGDVEARLTGARDLGRLGSSAREVAMPALIAATKDPDANVRAAAADGLGQIASDAADAGAAATALTALVKDGDPSVRISAVIAFRTLVTVPRAAGKPPLDAGMALAPLTDLIGDRDEGVRSAAFAALGVAGAGAGVAPPPSLVAALDAPSAGDRAAAASAISRFTQGLDPLIPSFLRGAEDPDPRSRTAYSRAIRNIKPPAVTAAIIPVLAEAIASPKPAVRCRAIELLVQLGPDGKALIPALVKIVKEPGDSAPGAPPSDDPVRSAASALGDLAPDTDRADEAIAALTEVLRREQPPRRGVAAIALGKFSRRATAAIPALVDLLGKSVPSQAPARDGPAAAEALGQIAPGTDRADEAIAALLAALEAKSRPIRIAAIESLVPFGAAGAAKVLPRLKELEKDPDRNVRQAAEAAAAELAPEPSPAAEPAPGPPLK